MRCHAALERGDLAWAKFCSTWGLKKGGKKKNILISFENAFHGRTLGAQSAGGFPELKEWIVNPDPDIHHVPFPDDFRCEDRSFALFEKTLQTKEIDPDDVAGVINETYQGGSGCFFPEMYVRALRTWCDAHGTLLNFDEVQSAFGRTGKFFAFEHYGITPDIIACGKGISSCMPLSAVICKSNMHNLI